MNGFSFPYNSAATPYSSSLQVMPSLTNLNGTLQVPKSEKYYDMQNRRSCSSC